MVAKRYSLVTLSAVSAISAPTQAEPQTPGLITAPAAAASQPVDYMANARRFARLRSYADCRADADASGDIVVCGRAQDEGLPVPEVYGPVAGSTDGAAVDPHGEPCGASISNRCYVGVDLPKLAGAVIGVVGLLIDPDRNLGEGTPIPERFRGANR